MASIMTAPCDEVIQVPRVLIMVPPHPELLLTFTTHLMRQAACFISVGGSLALGCSSATETIKASHEGPQMGLGCTSTLTD